MSQPIIKTTFKIRRGMAETWTRVNPILRAGEPGYELDTKKLKIGDGQTLWNDLIYVNAPKDLLPDVKFASVEQINSLFKEKEEPNGST